MDHLDGLDGALDTHLGRTDIKIVVEEPFDVFDPEMSRGGETRVLRAEKVRAALADPELLEKLTHAIGPEETAKVRAQLEEAVRPLTLEEERAQRVQEMKDEADPDMRKAIAARIRDSDAT